MKQNFQLHYFYGENENAIRAQVWCTLIAQLLPDGIAKEGRYKEGFFSNYHTCAHSLNKSVGCVRAFKKC
jgi:hypothetical protein